MDEIQFHTLYYWKLRRYGWRILLHHNSNQLNLAVLFTQNLLEQSEVRASQLYGTPRKYQSILRNIYFRQFLNDTLDTYLRLTLKRMFRALVAQSRASRRSNRMTYIVLHCVSHDRTAYGCSYSPLCPPVFFSTALTTGCGAYWLTCHPYLHVA